MDTRYLESLVRNAHFEALINEAAIRGMDVDWETLTLVPLKGYTKTWPEGDRSNRFDYEGGHDD